MKNNNTRKETLCWTKETPTADGWYFWCAHIEYADGSDPFYWESYYVTADMETETFGGDVDIAFWDNGTQVNPPANGCWRRVE